MLHYAANGLSGGTDLLIAHGLFGSARNWGVLSKRLSDSRRVVTVDMRNHGASPWFETNTYGDLAVDLATDAADGGLSDELGVWTEKQMYGKTYMGMVRSTFLIGGDGRILRVWPKVKVKGHAEEVLEAATKA